MFDCILIGYYTVLCTTWKYIVRVGIVLKTRIGRDAAGVEANTGFQCNTDKYNIYRLIHGHFHIGLVIIPRPHIGPRRSVGFENMDSLLPVILVIQK